MRDWVAVQSFSLWIDLTVPPMPPQYLCDVVGDQGLDRECKEEVLRYRDIDAWMRQG